MLTACICFALSSGSSESSHTSEKISLIVYDQLPASLIKSSCQAYIEEYARKAAQFTKCSILNARPLRFCEKCIEDYVLANSVYQHVMHVSGLIELFASSLIFMLLHFYICRVSQKIIAETIVVRTFCKLIRCNWSRKPIVSYTKFGWMEIAKVKFISYKIEIYIFWRFVP